MSKKPSKSSEAIARRLLIVEAGSDCLNAAPPLARVLGTLQHSLTRFAGSDGFTSLLRRALALARADLPSLDKVALKPDGSLEGLDQLAGDGSNDELDAASVTVVAYLLELLVTFIGESLTLRLVREAWPNAAVDG